MTTSWAEATAPRPYLVVACAYPGTPLELRGVALPELGRALLDGFRSACLGLLQLEGVARARLAQLLFVLGDFL